jgi:hypothetical protein
MLAGRVAASSRKITVNAEALDVSAIGSYARELLAEPTPASQTETAALID